MNNPVPADINDNEPSRDVEDLSEFLDMAEAAGGTLAVTSAGRLIIYGVKDADLVAERLNQESQPMYVDYVDAMTLGFNT